MAARFELNHAQITSRFKAKSINAAKAVAEAILQDSRPYVPKQEGTLGDVGHIETDATSASVVWDTVYAAYQWYGCWPDGSHVVKNHTTPGTSTKWVNKAMSKHKSEWDQIAQNAEENL